MLAAVMSIMVGASTPGPFVTGQKMHDWWVSAKRVEAGTGNGQDQIRLSFFQSYVMGVLDGLEPRRVLCVGDATLGQLDAIIGKWLDEHPQNWQNEGEYVVFISLAAAFPCPENK